MRSVRICRRLNVTSRSRYRSRFVASSIQVYYSDPRGDLLIHLQPLLLGAGVFIFRPYKVAWHVNYHTGDWVCLGGPEAVKTAG